MGELRRHGGTYVLDATDEDHESRPAPAPGKVTLTSRLPPVRRSAESTQQHVATAALPELGAGSALPSLLRSELEAALGFDLKSVRVHTDTAADQAARSLGARAFAVGRDIGFRAGAYESSTSDGLQLIAHEVAHTVQPDDAPAGAISEPGSSVEREAEAFAEHFVATRADREAAAELPAIAPASGSAIRLEREPATPPIKPKRVMVVGSPGPAEAKLHPLQFANAARFRGVDEDTVWIVEKTGYLNAGVEVSTVEGMAKPGKVIWLTPATGLTTALAAFPPGGIKELRVYSHGLPGQITLRYGWGDKGDPNYGLDLGQVKSLDGARFTPDATIEVDSCNAGTDTDQGNLAKEMAGQLDRPVSAWTGRTSYAEVNDGGADGDTEVKGSTMDKGGSRLTGGYDMSEVGSQLIKGRVPRRKRFEPGGFESTISIVARLPATQTFYVGAGGGATISFAAPRYERPPRAVKKGDQLTVVLHRDVDWGLDEQAGESTISLSGAPAATFSNLAAGTYYFEVICRSEPVAKYETFEADVSVTVERGAQPKAKGAAGPTPQ
jgi:hypothetical protein